MSSSEVERDLYVISDLHLGGEPEKDRLGRSLGLSGDHPEGAQAGVADALGEFAGSEHVRAPEGRGFRMMTRPHRLSSFIDMLARKTPPVELVINGDFVDFLAERHDEPPHWRPLLQDPVLALEVFRRVVNRPDDGAVFEALRKFVAAGHRFSLLLGNHDVELSYPAVRQALVEIVGPIEFIYDNEALVRGDVIIEHGNRYDRFNQVDHDGLRRLRSVQSRREKLPSRAQFAAPAGSRLVAEVMNPIKEEFAFVDLLKPENGAVIPTLLALRPSFRNGVLDVVKALGPGVFRGVAHDGEPKFAGNIHAAGEPTGHFAGTMGSSGQASMHNRSHSAADTSVEVNASALPSRSEATPEQIVFGERVALALAKEACTAPAQSSLGDNLDWLRSTLQLFIARSDGTFEERLPALLAALRLLAVDRSFSEDIETAPEYEDAARKLASAGFRYVIFGHTHLPKQVKLPNGGKYLNSGTWADRIRLPPGIFDPDEEKALAALRAFAVDLQTDGSRLRFRDYTYVRVKLRKTSQGWTSSCATLERWPTEPAVSSDAG